MLSCRDVTAHASAHVDGELSFRDRLAVRLHLAMCANCRRFSRQFHALVRSLKHRQRAQQVSDEFVERVLLSLDEDVDPPDQPSSPVA